MASDFSKDRAAKVLLEARLIGDQAASKTFGISTRSIRYWRSRLEVDEDFAAHFQYLKSLQDKAWGDNIPSAISACVNYLQRAAASASTSDPEVIHAIAGALKILNEVALTSKVINARLEGYNTPEISPKF